MISLKKTGSDLRVMALAAATFFGGGANTASADIFTGYRQNGQDQGWLFGNNQPTLPQTREQSFAMFTLGQQATLKDAILPFLIDVQGNAAETQMVLRLSTASALQSTTGAGETFWNTMNPSEGQYVWNLGKPGSANQFIDFTQSGNDIVYTLKNLDILPGAGVLNPGEYGLSLVTIADQPGTSIGIYSRLLGYDPLGIGNDTWGASEPFTFNNRLSTFNSDFYMQQGQINFSGFQSVPEPGALPLICFGGLAIGGACWVGSRLRFKPANVESRDLSA